jgi:hypothetical protein
MAWIEESPRALHSEHDFPVRQGSESVMAHDLLSVKTNPLALGRLLELPALAALTPDALCRRLSKRK